MENNKPKQPNKPPKKEQERLSKEDLLELMGYYTPTYKRVNGRIRRKR